MILKAADNQIKIVVIDVKEIGTEFILFSHSLEVAQSTDLDQKNFA